MKYRLTILPLFLLLAAAFLLAGCSDESGNPLQSNGTAEAGSDEYEAMDFSLPYGGLTASDEDVAFGDKGFQDMLLNEAEGESNDPLTNDPGVREQERRGGMHYANGDTNRPQFTFLKLNWGMLQGPGEQPDTLGLHCPALDWSGTIQIDRGNLVVRRLILFEGPDHLIHPRPDRQTVNFASWTWCHFDGLLLEIIEEPGEVDPQDGEPNMLHIRTGPYSQSFVVADLVGLEETTVVDDLGNSINLMGYSLTDIDYCPKGFLPGRWHVLPADVEPDSMRDDHDLAVQIGTFSGPWIGLGGHIRGFMRCGYGLDGDGNQVFHGKRISRRGQYEALVTGTWEAAGDGVSLAAFEGTWSSDNGIREGVLGASAYPCANREGGWYEGRWSTLCDPEAEDQIY